MISVILLLVFTMLRHLHLIALISGAPGDGIKMSRFLARDSTGGGVDSYRRRQRRYFKALDAGHVNTRHDTAARFSGAWFGLGLFD